MDDLFEKLSEFLGSEDGKAQLSALTAALGGDAPSNGAATDGQNRQAENADTPAQGAPVHDTSAQGASEPSASVLGSDTARSAVSARSAVLPDGIDMETLFRLSRIIGQLNSRKEDNNTRLIQALKPHLRAEHRRRADEAVRVLKLLDLLPALREMDLF